MVPCRSAAQHSISPLTKNFVVLYRAQPSTARLEATDPCMPIMPVESGSSPGMEPPPIRVMATGASSFLAKARNSSCALLRVTPPPQISMGFFD